MEKREAKTAVLLVAHGSRQEDANQDLHWLADELRARGVAEHVVPSFLELCSPNIDEGARRCIDLGANRVVLTPYFLSAGVHVKRDLESSRERLAAAFPHVEFLLAEPLGRHQLLADVLRQRICAVLNRRV